MRLLVGVFCLTACSFGPTAALDGGQDASDDVSQIDAPTLDAPAETTVTDAGDAGVMLGGSWGRVGILQLWDYYMAVSDLGPPMNAAPKTDWIWGGTAGAGPVTPSDWLSLNANVIDSRYFGISVDTGLPSTMYPNRDLAWYQAQHPDWILYDCDGANQPTMTVAYQPSWNHIPIDIHNQAAVEFEVFIAAEYAKGLHFNALAADQILFFNYYGGQGTSGDYWGCGTYSGSTFVRRYNPTYTGTGGAKTFPNYDPQYKADMGAAVKIARDYLHLHYPGMKLIVNHTPGSISDPAEQALLQNTDAAFTEIGTTSYGKYATSPGFVANAWAYAEYAQAHGTPILNMNVMEGSSTLSSAQIEWTLATYEMSNEGSSYLWLSASSGPGTWSWQPQYQTIDSQLGTPCAAFSGGPTLYQRRFTGGLVIANISASTTTPVTLPAGHTYVDLMGRSVTNPLPVAPADAYVLFTSNGCM